VRVVGGELKITCGDQLRRRAAIAREEVDQPSLPFLCAGQTGMVL